MHPEDFDDSMYSASEMRNMEKAKELAAETEFPFVSHALGHQWQGYDLFFTGKSEGTAEGPVLLVDGEDYRWIPVGSPEEDEIDFSAPCY